jgi:hypothetical protein
LRPVVQAVVLLMPGAWAFAQAPDGPQPSASSATTWSFRAAAATYVFSEDDDYVQPTVTADRGAVHLEARYNYEDRRSVSGFAGWNLAVGSTVSLEVTPMFGAVVGDTDGVIPAVEVTVSVGPVEFNSEGEYLIDLNRSRDSFFYSWSELSVWPTDWLRAGLVAQRTRVFQRLFREPLDIHRGLLVGITVRWIEGVVYFFNPGSDDDYVVASVGVSF